MPRFIQANTVTAGDKTTSTQIASLAAAFNSRLLSGVGDSAWRIAFYFHGIVRSLRNPNESFTAYPPDAEFWNFYQFIEPTDGEWPQTGPGDPEGGNLANILMSWVYGPPSPEIGAEKYRLGSIPTGIEGYDTLSPSQIWYLGQLQRGAYDPDTGNVNWPVGDVAKAYAYVRQSISSPHGNAFGGWLPVPEDAGGCSDPQDTNYQYLFTNLVTGATKQYTTNCPEDGGAVQISYTPWAYYVIHSSGMIEVLAKAQWIEGPYTENASLLKTQSNALGRGLASFASEYRGTEEQKAKSENKNKNAFDLQKFLTTQYPLAPNFGVSVGDSIQPIYPSWQTKGTSAAAGTSFGKRQDWPEDTVCTGFVIVGSKLTKDTSIRLSSNGEVVFELSLASGDSEQLFWVKTPSRLQNVTASLTDSFSCQSGGGIFVEANALIEYKPQIHDYFLVTRLSGWNGSLTAVDGRGIDETKAKEICTNLYANGCVIPVADTGDGFGPAGFDPAFNANGTYDAIRRWIKSMVRIIPRWNLTGYAVENGKSVLYYNRTAYGPPDLPARDMWDGIGPSETAIPSGSIKWGRKYTIKSGSVTYGPENEKRTYLTGSTFIGLEGIKEYEGGGIVMEYDGIKQTAEPNDWSNRWCLAAELKPYSNSISSIWKQDAFGDINTPLFDRCHMGSPEIDNSKVSKRQVSYGQTPLVPEAPSGYRYMRMFDNTFNRPNANYAMCDEADEPCNAKKNAFYKSCRIYEPPIEIESTVTENGQLKVTLVGRLHAHENAPASISKDPTTWDLTALAAENYRTRENGIRDYIAREQLGVQSQWKVGDDALNSTIQDGTDTPLGACLPTFYLTKLIPEPYLDDSDDTADKHDSRRTHDQLKQCEVYLRAMCEGFVDAEFSATQACENGTVTSYDYTYENLMYQAGGNRWVPWNTAIRSDNPYTFGPLPNHKFYAEQWNALANGVNLLTDARVMLPSEIQHRDYQKTSSKAVVGRDGCGVPQDCSTAGSTYFSYTTETYNVQGELVSDWLAGTQGTSRTLELLPSTDCSGSNWKLQAITLEQDFRWWLIDPNARAALPGDLQTNLDNNSAAIAQFSELQTQTKLIYSATPIEPAPLGTTGACGTSYAWFEQTDTVNSTYCDTLPNHLTPPTIPPGIAMVAQAGGSSAGAAGSTSLNLTLVTEDAALVRIPTRAYLAVFPTSDTQTVDVDSTRYTSDDDEETDTAVVNP